LTYSPFGVGDSKTCGPWDPATGNFCLGADRVATDLEIIASMTRRIKTYSINPCYDRVVQILQFARRRAMKVQLGVWMANQEGEDNYELDQMTLLVASYADVISEILIGNELVFIVKASTQYQARRLGDARSRVLSTGKKIPIGCAEVWNTWWDNPGAKEIVAASDFIGLNSHPWWTGVDPFQTNVGQNVVDSAFAINSKWKKKVIVTETGYPSAGPAHGAAQTSLGRMERAAKDIEAMSRTRNVPVYFFEPFDGDWKRRWLVSDTGIDYHFGLRDCNRNPKSIALPPGGALA
jgi:exo-beta-1,3-glucanase (GH17 family)